MTLTSKEKIAKANANNVEPRSLKLKGYVGFDNIARQYVTESTRKGFALNILCVGDTGIGKSTLMNTLFNTDFNLEQSSHNKSNVSLDSNTFQLTENGIDLKLTIIETSGFGDQINKENSHEPILKYINDQYEARVQNELGLNRNFEQINDTIVHICLYFISPTGHSLKTIDVNTMKALDRKLNIIPIIAKADTIGKNELTEFKKRVISDINKNHIDIYYFPINDSDLEVSNLNAATNALFPLAVIGSSELVKIGNKLTKGRRYEWGTVSVENESHCDFIKFRDMLLSTNMWDIIELTHSKHYQLYRAQRLKEIGFKDEHIENSHQNIDISFNKTQKSKNVFDIYNIKRTELNEEIQQREFEIKEDFVRKVKEKEFELRENEKELNNKFNKFKQEQIDWNDRIDQKRRELDALYRNLNERKFTLERSKTLNLNSVNFDKKKNKHK